MLMRQDLLRAQRRLLEKEEEVLAVSRMPTSGMIQSIRQELGSVERKLGKERNNTMLLLTPLLLHFSRVFFLGV